MKLTDSDTDQIFGRQASSTQAPPRPRAIPLSPREQDVLKLLAQGHTNQEVGTRLHLSVKTIETHRARLMDKLGLRSRAELTRYALEMGLLGPGQSPLR